MTEPTDPLSAFLLTAKIRTIGEGAEQLFCAVDVAWHVGDDNYRRTLKEYPESYSRKMRFPDAQGRVRDMRFLTTTGINHFLVTSRLPKAKEFARAFGIVAGIRYESKENETVSRILAVFGGAHRHARQKKVTCRGNEYRIDLYFEDECLAVECDEHDHKNRNQAAEKQRQAQIEAQLGCEFLRYNPDSPEFDIFVLLGLIYEHFRKCYA